MDYILGIQMRLTILNVLVQNKLKKSKILIIHPIRQQLHSRILGIFWEIIYLKN